MRRVLKTVMVAVLIFTIAMPMNLLASASAKDFDIKVPQQKRQTATISEELVGYAHNESDQVRVIVEMEEAPIIDYATTKGVQVKDLSPSFVDSKVNELESTQDALIGDMEGVVPGLEVHEKFTNVFNGFSATITYGDVQEVANMPGVKAVGIANEYSRPEPQMVSSTTYTQHKLVNEEYGFTGEGMVVAIIDTGIDPSHDDFILDEGVEVGLSMDAVMTAIEDEGLLGEYYTEKVPYGYNYMDNNTEILDLGIEASMHGMHVAGTVAANGDEENGGIKGVAPNAQVLALKVFGNDPQFPSTFGDIIIAAIDDAIILGADVMNLSLGSTAAFVDETDPEQIAVTNAVENGILMSISAGNSNRFGAGSAEPYPYAENPDVGVVGSPGLVSESLQVASVDNMLYLYETTAHFEGMDAPVMGYGKDEWDTSATFEVVAIGGSKLGAPEDYEGLDVTGKVVLVSRGAFSFYDKTETAAAMGAVGIVVYDHGLSTFYMNQGGWSVPFMKISKDEGLALEALLETGESLELTVEYGPNGKYVDPVSGLMSDFSSWGTTPDLSFKPEISAPGGNIYSTFNDDTYGFMSGTSMAAPHVAGGSALVMERIQKDPIFAGIDLESSEVVTLAKNILMNTAVPVMDKEYGFTYASPRQQGAGSMNLKYAMDTNVVVTDSTTGVAKVNLGEIETNVLMMELDIKNYGDDVARFEPEAQAQAMYPSGGYNLQVPVPLEQMVMYNLVDGDEMTPVEQYIDVPAGETVTLNVVIVVSPADIAWLEAQFYNGFFIEGFVNLYTDDEILGQAKDLAYDDYMKLAEAVDTAMEEYDEADAAADLLVNGDPEDENDLGLTGDLDALVLELEGLQGELDAMVPALEAVMAKYDEIEDKKAEIETLVEIYESESYLFALLVGDLADVAVASEFLMTIINEYEREISRLEGLIAELETKIADFVATANMDKLRNQRKVARWTNQLDEMKAHVAVLKDELAGFEAVMDDFDLYLEVYLRHRARVEAAEAAVEAAQAELQALEDGITQDDLDVIAAYEAKQAEIEAKQAEIEAKQAEIDAAWAVVDALVPALLALMGERDEAYAEYLGLKDVFMNALPLSVPFISFYGDWSVPPAFDVTAYDPFGYSFYGETYMITVDEMDGSTIYFNYLGVKEGSYLAGDAVAISPDGDGYKDNATARFSLLRNLKDITFRVESEDGYLVYMGAYPELRKNYFYYGTSNSSYIMPEFTWDGNAPDGQYSYIIEGILADGSVQSLEMPVYVDTVAPIINGFTVGRDAVTVDAEDIGAGIDEYILLDAMSGDVLMSSYAPVFDLANLNGDVHVVTVVAIDYAGNIGFAGGIEVVNDNDIPEVRLDLDPFSVLDTREFDVNGVVYEALAPVVYIDGEMMEIDEEGAFVYHASYDSDGKKALQVDATDFAGNDISFQRHFYIDSLAPVISPMNDDFYDGNDNSIVYVDDEVDMYNIQALFMDNFPDMTVKVNNDAWFVSNADFVAYEDQLQPVDYYMDLTFPLDYGYNTFVLDAKDVTGKVTTETIIVHRAMDGEADPGMAADMVTMITEEQTLFVGESFDLEFEATLLNGTVEQNPERALILADTAAVSIDGVTVTAEELGVAVVTVNVDGEQAMVTVNVVEPEATEVEILNEDPQELTEDDSFILNFLTTYEDASQVSNSADAVITADDDSVVIVDREITVTEDGTFVVTVEEDGVTADLTLNVAAKPAPAPSTPSVVIQPSAPVVEEEILEDEEIALASPLFKGSKFINGYTDKTFRADAAITRAEISAIINRVVLLDEASTTDFDDVQASFWAVKHIATMEKAGLIKGYNGMFNPENNITRAEMATIVARIIKMAEIDVEVMANPFTDLEGHWALEDIMKAYSYGVDITNGSTSYLPDQKLTRAEAVVMINQLIGVVVEEAGSSTFEDLDATYWAYNHIMSAAE